MIPVAAPLFLSIGGPYLWLGYQHYSTFGGLNVAVHAVLLFLCINLVICLWELVLCYKHALIRSTHAKRVKDGQVRQPSRRERGKGLACLCVGTR